MAKNTSVLGIYPDRSTVSEAIQRLQEEGYRPADIAILVAENSGSKDFAMEKRTKAPEGAALGVAIGAAAGAVAGWLSATGAVSLYGLESVAHIAPVVAALAGAGFGGAIGGLIGLFIGFGMPAYVAKRYAGRTRRGGILLSVHCDNSAWIHKARKALTNTGARYVACAPESTADYATADKPAPRPAPTLP